MKKYFCFAIWLLFALLWALPSSADVLINEVMADNGVFIDGENDDWIELYNSGDRAVSLTGFGLSDKKSEPLAWTFPEGATIAPGGYALVYCTGEEISSFNLKRNVFYANFKLSADGETIYFSDPQGALLSDFSYPAQFGGVSYGLSFGGAARGFLPVSSPNAQNAAVCYQARAEKPVLDTPAGFYAGAVTVSVVSDDPVYYTLDGSDPLNSPLLYETPLTFSKTTVLRVCARPNGLLSSKSETATYIINDPAVTAVVSLSTDDGYMNDPVSGAFVRGKGSTRNYNLDLEYPMHLEYFDLDGARQLNQTGSFRVVGTSSRAARQKSIAITARTAYGDGGSFLYNPFKDRDYASYHTLVLRSSGSDISGARMSDAVLTSLSNGLGVMYQAALPVVVYINGEYAGHYNLREKVNKYSVAQWEGVTQKSVIDNIDMLQGEARDDQIQNGDNKDWLALRAFVRENDLNIPENLSYVTEQLDVDSLFSWACFELVILNQDLENVRVYRVPGGKWKYILYDVEGGLTSSLQGVYMLLDSSRAGGRLSSQYSLIKKLTAVPEMREKFLRRLAFVIENSFLYQQTVKPVVDEWEATLKQILPRHFKKYNNLTMSNWKSNVSAKRTFLRISPKKVINAVCECLNVSAQEKEKYFAETLRLLEINNSKEAQ